VSERSGWLDRVARGYAAVQLHRALSGACRARQSDGGSISFDLRGEVELFCDAVDVVTKWPAS
jgi:hypothetical protein